MSAPEPCASWSRNRPPHRHIALMLALCLGPVVGYAAPLSLLGPGVKASQFRITVFATNLSYPLGMARLADGSLLVSVNEGASFWNSTGKVVRLIDADQDGIADGTGAV